ncbi:hemolysin family protein [Sanguibacter suaedae]|uniref:HlyC/CorC family transporter n=1 Tax=Sanguibacter suaedae TaxID=2795737 RepID=A0A934IAA9_9MICO|nr:hemolysin family protein [Sanguibacter suaedae]MBI9115982.1 HlyC/CorC family transporter [Sanguibacter suaedae]
MSTTLGLLVGVALLLGNAFFVGAEFALISARRTQIEPRAASRAPGARLALRAIDNVSLMMAGAQLGITMCSLGLGAVAEPAVAHLIEVPLGAAGVPESLLHPIALVIALTFVVFLHMTLGEMVPKNIAIAGPERSALLLGPPLYIIVQVLKPLIVTINWIANHILRALKVDPKDEVSSTFTADEVAGFIAESRQEGLLDEDEHTLLTGALTMSDEVVRSVMVPVDDVVSLQFGATYADAEAACVRTGFSRFPVKDHGGGFAGYVHLKDLLAHDDPPHAEVPERLIRPLVCVDAEDALDTALATMQLHGNHVALVTDGDDVVGAAMLEDVVERLVGEIADAAQLAHAEEPVR